MLEKSFFRPWFAAEVLEIKITLNSLKFLKNRKDVDSKLPKEKDSWRLMLLLA